MSAQRIYADPAAFIRSEPQKALAACELHGIPLADCDCCTRYDGECDLGGCNRRATHVGIVSVGDQVRQRRPICSRDVDFARSLGMTVEQVLPSWYDLPGYVHVRHCIWGHIQKCCPSGCNGEPVDYPDAIEHAEGIS